MKTTFILTIFGLLALANAQFTAPRRAQKTNDDYYDYEAPYANPRYGLPAPTIDKAYAHPGYEQPAYKRLAKRAAYKLPEESVDPKTNPDPPADKAYAHPGYKQPAYKRLAKSFLPKINNYYYEDVYGEPGRVAPVAKTNDDNYGPTLRLAKSFTPKINDYYYDHAAYPVQRYVPPAMDPGYEQPAKRLAKREAPKINDYYNEDVYGEPGRVAPVAKTNDDNNGPKAYIAYERLAKRDAAAYAAKIQKKTKIAAVSVEDLNNPEYEDAPQQEAQARSADYEADDLLA